MKKATILILISSLIFLGGCAGTNFVRLADSQLKHNVDTTETVRKKLGKPYREGIVTKNELSFKTLAYSYASTGGKATYKGVTAAKSQGFYFYENMLVGDEYTSSYAVDSTDFDESKISRIKKGVTTITEAIGIMGPAGGEYSYPLTSNNGEKAKIYLYSQTKGSAFNLEIYQKTLILTYDPSGLVTDVEYTESGSK